MTDTRLKYVQQYKDRHGKIRRYFRRGRQRGIALPGKPGSDRFMKVYQACLDNLPPPAQRRAKKRLQSLDEIRQAPSIGVYLLFLAGELVYVGSSTTMPARVANHRSNGRPFDRAYFIATKLSERGAIERALIRAFHPPQNRVLRNA